MKKRLAFLFAVAIAVVALAAALVSCGTGTQGQMAPATPQPAQAPPTPDAMGVQGDSMAKDETMMKPDGAIAKDDSMESDDAMAKDDSMGSDDAMKADGATPSGPAMGDDAMENQDDQRDPAMAGDSMKEDDAMSKEDATMNDGAMGKPDSMMKSLSSSEDPSAATAQATSAPEDRYVAYSPEALATATQRGRAVLFFKADWCSTCRVADADFRANLDRIPADVTVLLVDYDREADLKRQYLVTYQHTFIQVDGLGRQVSRWNGGGVAELLANLL